MAKTKHVEEVFENGELTRRSANASFVSAINGAVELCKVAGTIPETTEVVPRIDLGVATVEHIRRKYLPADDGTDLFGRLLSRVENHLTIASEMAVAYPTLPKENRAGNPNIGAKKQTEEEKAARLFK